MQKAIMDREELFRQMTENVDGMFWAITGDIGKILYLGPAYEKIWGVPPKDLASQQAPFFDAIPPEDQERLMAVWRRISQDKVNVEVMHRVIRPDGSKRWVQTRGFPVKNEMGDVYPDCWNHGGYYRKETGGGGVAGIRSQTTCFIQPIARHHHDGGSGRQDPADEPLPSGHAGGGGYWAQFFRSMAFRVLEMVPQGSQESVS